MSGVDLFEKAMADYEEAGVAYAAVSKRIIACLKQNQSVDQADLVAQHEAHARVEQARALALKAFRILQLASDHDDLA